MRKSTPSVLFRFIFLVIVSTGLLSAIPANALSSHEEDRINALLVALEKRTDLVFIRNGSEYTATEAVAHLRLKLDNTRDRLDSAEQFIDKVASSSSMSGKPYLIREPGKEAQPANAFLHELLKQVALQ